MIKCTTYAYSISPHVSQLYTGFSMLASAGAVSLRQVLAPPAEVSLPSAPPHQTHGLYVRVEQNLVYYDLSDHADVDRTALDAADTYFKRSYRRSSVPDHAVDRVVPLGLNYEVYPGRRDLQELARLVGRPGLYLGSERGTCIRGASRFLGVRYRPTVDRLHSPAQPELEPRVLFLARAWEPDGGSRTDASARAAQRRSINEMRAAAMRLLRRELGDRFVGGMVRSPYAMAAYPDVVCPDWSMTEKRRYLDLVRATPICVASAGLHDSNGWKLGEYVAFSRAIVSEKLAHEVPHGFSSGENYLEFDSPETCVSRCLTLVDDPSLRAAIMEGNQRYYRRYLAPDQLVAWSLGRVQATS